LLKSNQQEYQTLWDTAVVDPQWDAQAHLNAKKILSHINRYDSVAKKFNAMHGYLVGLIHMMESGFNFDCHLFNGDPLTARTVNVPAGQPASGSPPFSWEESAEAALTYRGANHFDLSGIPGHLHFLESWNGLGYRKHGINTPYLWCGTNHYVSGKFVKDGSFDPNAQSKQVGCAAVLKVILSQSAQA
jgi:lysozyme family protein